jgi:2-methylcitrate dehydratase PrpD
VERYSETVAQFVRDITLESVPAEVARKAKLIFLDALGIALASSTMDFGRMVLAVARALGGLPGSRLIGTSDK